MGRDISGDINHRLWFAVQDSNAADRFGVTGHQPEELYYYFSEEDLPQIRQELKYIENKLGNILEKLRKYFEENPYYSEEKVAKYLKISPNGIQSILKDYADYKLGLKIAEAVQTTGQCEFTAEL